MGKLRTMGHAALASQGSPSTCYPNPMPHSRGRYIYGSANPATYAETRLTKVDGCRLDASEKLLRSIFDLAEKLMEPTGDPDHDKQMDLADFLLPWSNYRVQKVEEALASKRRSKSRKTQFDDVRTIYAEHGVPWTEDSTFDIKRYGRNNAFYNSLSEQQRAIVYFNDEKNPLPPEGPEQTLDL